MGLPSFVGKKKKASFEYIKERVWRKLQGWGEKLLSQAGREVLIKAMVQAIPTYTMNCFKLPLDLCEEIESMIRKFWWGQRGDRRKIHWVSWGFLCKPKTEGGMGFKNLALFNNALLDKQAWRLLHNKDSLFYWIFKSKFFPHGSIMDAPVWSQGGSYAWKSLLKGREVLRKGLKWQIGTGDVVNLWSGLWLPSTIQPLIQSPMVHDFANAKVSSIINPTYKCWDTNLLNRLFLPHEVLLIQSIPLSHRPIKDKLVWPYNLLGVYSVKSGYKLLSQEMEVSDFEAQGMDNDVWKVVWGLKVQNKIRNFFMESHPKLHTCEN